MAISVLLLLATPITNTMTRSQEAEADMYGLNASRQPDGFAAAMLKLGQYRKMEPDPVERVCLLRPPQRTVEDPGGDAMEGPQLRDREAM